MTDVVRRAEEPSVATDRVLSPGDVVAGRWAFEEQLSAGGRSSVWRATDCLLERRVVIKRLRTEFLHDPKMVGRFRRQADVLGLIQHDHVMRLYDVSQDGPDLLLICEFVDGIGLDTVMASRDRLDAEQVVGLAVQLADGLQALHAHEVVHRRLVPRRIMVARGGTIKLVGMSDARWLRDHSTAGRLAIEVDAVDYLAPEQLGAQASDARAQPVNDARVQPVSDARVQPVSDARVQPVSDARVDVYAAGLILWEALAGERPFPDGLTRDLGADPPPVSTRRPDVPPALADVIATATRADPQRRYRDAGEMLTAMLPLARGRPTALTAGLVDR